jgi:pimeloyl-ACP methyl ester carboxylesterase
MDAVADVCHDGQVRPGYGRGPARLGAPADVIVAATSILPPVPAQGLDAGMERVELDGVQVEYELLGDGEPVVLPHALPFVSWYTPLSQTMDRAVLRYRRSVPAGRSWRVEDDGVLCAQLLTRLGVERPDVVGHSYGGLVALELARDHGVEPRSVALLEPAMIGLLPPEDAAGRMGPLLQAAQSDGPAAMSTFLRVVCGENGAAEIERLVPGSLDEAMANADAFFSVEFPAAIRWSFAPGDVRADLPVLTIRGTESAPRSVEAAEIVRSWFPNSEISVLDGASHLLVAEQPAAIAKRLAEFWAFPTNGTFGQ